jgi:hypothetical protein
MDKPDVWHLVWIIVLILGGVLLALGFFFALLYREESETANFASIWGIWVALIGFALTIYTMIETQRASRKAQREVQAATIEAQQKIEAAARQAQEAVEQAQEQIRQVLERVRTGVREANYWTLLMWAKSLRHAAMQRDWPRALLISEECTAVGERLGQAEGLAEDERTRLRERIDDIRVLHAFIRTERMPDSPTQQLGLDNEQARLLDDLIRLLETLGGRLYHEPTKGATP